MSTIQISHTILWHGEKACQALVVAGAPPWLPKTQIYRGMENREDESMEGRDSSLKVRPCVTVSCLTASAIQQNWKGIWTPTLEVAVEANRAKTNGDEADQQASEIFDLFLAVDAAKTISSLVQGFLVRELNLQTVSRRASGRAWVSTMTWEMKHCTRAPLT